MDDIGARLGWILERFRAHPLSVAPVRLSDEELCALREVERFPCNRSGQDKSWFRQPSRDRSAARATPNTEAGSMSLEGDLLHALAQRRVRYVAIGVWGANQYARDPRQLFVTQDRDLFLPSDEENLLRAWDTCESVGLELVAGTEPLDRPRDLVLARAVVTRRALTRATDGHRLLVDLTLVMAGFDFETAWSQRRVFQVEGAELPVASLEHIVTSKAKAGRPKDLLFLATYADMLTELGLKRVPPGAQAPDATA